jgi:carbonic anhydrase
MPGICLQCGEDHLAVTGHPDPASAPAEVTDCDSPDFGTPHIVVLGHGACAGARALLQGAPEDAREFVAPWMSIASQALTRALACREGDPQRCCEYELVKVSLDNLMTFPWIAERVEAGRLRLHGAWFGIESGELLILQPNGSFAKPTQ